MNFEQKAEYSSFDEICGKCLSMNSEDNVKRLLDQPDTDADLYVEIDVRPISDLIKGVDAGCPCCIFIAGVVDCSDLSEAESTVVSISCELLRERGGDHHQVPLQVRFWANLKTEFGGSELKCAYWNANALEGRILKLYTHPFDCFQLAK